LSHNMGTKDPASSLSSVVFPQHDGPYHAHDFTASERPRLKLDSVIERLQ
jgi:hypothetical protein